MSSTVGRNDLAGGVLDDPREALLGHAERGLRKPGQQRPSRTGRCNSTVRTRIGLLRSRLRFRPAGPSGLFRPEAAPNRPAALRFIRHRIATPIMSRSTSGSQVFSPEIHELIITPAIGAPPGSAMGLAVPSLPITSLDHSLRKLLPTSTPSSAGTFSDEVGTGSSQKFRQNEEKERVSIAPQWDFALTRDLSFAIDSTEP